MAIALIGIVCAQVVASRVANEVMVWRDTNGLSKGTLRWSGQWIYYAAMMSLVAVYVPRYGLPIDFSALFAILVAIIGCYEAVAGNA